MVGGGIVGLPYAFLELGIVMSCVLMFIVALLTINSTWLYLKAKDLVMGKPESLYELGYVILGRQSIFMISSILVLNAFGLVMVYFIVFSDTMASVIGDLFSIGKDDDGF